ncbi:MAG: DUF1385 domain-containing protein [Solirubrobacteraceae bacterium]
MSSPDKLRLGGMALDNGLLVHGPEHWAAAVRARDGAIRVASGSKPRVRGVERVPGARGVARLAEAFAVIPLAKRALPEARLPFQNGGVLAAVAVTVAAGSLLKRRGGTGGEVAAAALSLLPALVALRGGELAAYHGTEHKVIGAYETESEAQEASKEHERCGSHLVVPMMVSNVAGVALLKRFVQRPGPLAGGVVALASLGAAVEVFVWSERHADTRTARALRRPGFELQRALGTREPTEEQLEVGRAALDEILRVEGVSSPDGSPGEPRRPEGKR